MGARDAFNVCGRAVRHGGGGVALLGTAGVSRGAVPRTATLLQTFDRIEHKPVYRRSTWGIDALDQRSGKVLASQNAPQMFDPGSTMKLYSVSTGLRLYGTRYRFRTPVYREGNVAHGTLTGNLVLVGSGDLTFGLREPPGQRLAYEKLPAVDDSYADQLPGAVEPHGNPWLAMRHLAQRVRASGIARINGNAVIDDRLFRSWQAPDGEISPIWFNENLVDLLVTPGRRAGTSARINWLTGIKAEVKTATGLGVPRSSLFPQDGLPNSPAAGHAQIKTGNRVVGNPAGQIMVLGNSLAGYIQARSGRRVTVMIAVGNVPMTTPKNSWTSSTIRRR
jgi:D-alanyl-D-alanine carboxypeptidase